ncbi:MAG: hypothetical protein HIU92_00220 [Proteobacteria bacterium]|nr:hypothetical protein [Pseudomonadota bacterium]
MTANLLSALFVVVSMAVAATARAAAPMLMMSTISADNLVAKLYRPSGEAGPLPAVIVLGGSEGGLNPAVTAEAKLLARHGYAALQLGYFGAPGLPETLELVPVEYFEHAVDWLRARPDVDPAHIGIVGTSIGGEAALLVAAHDPAIKAVVAAVPSNVVWQGLGRGITRHPASSFMLRGQPLPDVPFGWTGVRGDVYRRYAGGLAALPQHRQAIIPVERIDGPIMLICGGRDRIWPSCRMAASVAARLKAKNFRNPVSFLAYAAGGHAVFGVPLDPDSPDYEDLGSLGGSAAANDAARRNSWGQMLAFLDRALQPAIGRSTIGFRPGQAAP